MRFGAVEIDGDIYEHDVIVVAGHVKRRKKKASRTYRGHLGHTPLSIAEPIPWKGTKVIVGTGA